MAFDIDSLYDAFPKLDFTISTLWNTGLSRNAYLVVHLEAERFQLRRKHQMADEVFGVEQLEFLSSTEETSPIIGRLLCIDGRSRGTFRSIFQQDREQDLRKRNIESLKSGSISIGWLCSGREPT